MPPRLAALTTSLARIAWVSGWPSSPTRAVDDLDVGPAEPRDERRVLALGDDDVGPREQLDGAHGQQLGVAGAGADEGDAAACGRAGFAGAA